MILRLAILALCLAAAPVRGQEDRSFTLGAPPEIARSGLLEYILPRFTLKTGRRATLVPSGGDARIDRAAPGATSGFARGDEVYALSLATGNPAAALFADWLGSAPGQAAITGFVPATGAPFVIPKREAVAAEVAFEGDAALGKTVARRHCARCHRVDDSATMEMGLAPSFAVLRALPDWSERLPTFYQRRPHPAFVQVEGLSTPFDPASPPAIVPVRITLAEFDALLAYASAVAPADLGAEIENR